MTTYRGTCCACLYVRSTAGNRRASTRAPSLEALLWKLKVIISRSQATVHNQMRGTLTDESASERKNPAESLPQFALLGYTIARQRVERLGQRVAKTFRSHPVLPEIGEGGTRTPQIPERLVSTCESPLTSTANFGLRVDPVRQSLLYIWCVMYSSPLPIEGMTTVTNLGIFGQSLKSLW